jgi:hypothetical protein
MGRDAYVSAPDSSKLTGDLDGPREEALVAIASPFSVSWYFRALPGSPAG